MKRGDSYFRAEIEGVEFGGRGGMAELTIRTGKGDFDVAHMLVTKTIGKECVDLIGSRVWFSVTVEPDE